MLKLSLSIDVLEPQIILPSSDIKSKHIHKPKSLWDTCPVRTAKPAQTHPWPVVDYPVELDNDAGLPFTEAERRVVVPGAATEQRFAKAARFPLAFLTLQTSPLGVRPRSSCTRHGNPR